MIFPYVWKMSAPQIMLNTALEVVITSDMFRKLFDCYYLGKEL